MKLYADQNKYSGSKLKSDLVIAVRWMNVDFNLLFQRWSDGNGVQFSKVDNVSISSSYIGHFSVSLYTY